MSPDPSELKQAHLNQVPGRISAILENWHQLVHGDWHSDFLDTLLERLQTLAESSNKLGIREISQSARSLINHLSEYSETNTKPQHDDVVALDGLIHAFNNAALQACEQHMNQPPPAEPSQPERVPDEKCRIYLLGLNPEQIPEIVALLEEEQYLVETLTDEQRLIQLAREDSKINCAVISHTDWLPKLYPEDRQQGIWSQDGGLPGLNLVFLSENDDLQTRLQAMRTEAKAFWTLPLEPVVVTNRLGELTQTESRAPSRVLIVDDDPAQADFASAILTKADFECRTVTEPLQVLKTLDEFKPDLILMDLYMPGASGSELTVIIHERSEFVDTPIVFLSGEQDLDKQLNALSLGGEDFLSKPIGPKHLIKTVSNRIKRSKQLTRDLGGLRQTLAEGELATRNQLFERTETALLSGAVTEQVTVALYLEVDNDEELISQVGIGGLDAVLAETGKFIKSQIQPKDILSRFGDNSLGLLIRRASLEAVQQEAESLCHKVADQVFEVDNHTLGLTLSIGGQIADSADRDAYSLFSHAKLASRQARQSGGNGAYIPQPQKRQTATDETKNLSELIKKAIEEGLFEIYYQPMVALKGQSGPGRYQTLIRLQDPDGRVLKAGEFLPQAEQMGLINKIDQWVTKKALYTISEFKAQGTKVHLFISQSAELLENINRLSWLQDKHRNDSLEGKSLTFEFRLDEVARNLNSAKICFEMLGKMGITTLLTGVSFSAEAQRTINHLPVSFIKLDTSLMQQPDKNFQDLITLAHTKQIQVIAPRVEDPQSIAFLWSSGVDFVQGNFVQRPEINPAYDFNDSVLN
jgi:diguanylate cyclase (GGDEF)-like protein